VIAPGNQVDPPIDRSGMPREPRPVRLALGVLGSVALLAFAACGSDSGPELSEAGARGRKVSNSNGCASCHGTDGQGGVGPEWVGLAGSDVTLEGGSVVVADDDYLRQAIVDPSAQIVAGYTLKMPENDLSDDEVTDVIAYIHDLSPGEPGG
jgi:mono/diheme cytochrome c family protein